MGGYPVGDLQQLHRAELHLSALVNSLASDPVAEARFSGLADAGWCDAGSQVDQTVTFEHLHGCFGLNLGQNAQVRHHEDAVLGQGRDPFGLECVDEHCGGLGHARGVRENAAGGDQEIQGHVVDDCLATGLLAEGVTDGSLLLDSLESRGEVLVLLVGQSQRLTGDSLFK